jgi:ribosome maturation factor RimP
MTELVSPTIEMLGFELWGLEYIPAGKQSTLRIYIDRPGDEGVNVSDCGQVSHQISALLDVEDPIQSAYMLEISSPGMDRPLFQPAQFAAYQGETVQVRASGEILGRKRFKGKMTEVNEQGIVVEVDNEAYDIPFEMIDKANVVPIF